jgi:hypothetical protein
MLSECTVLPDVKSGCSALAVWVRGAVDLVYLAKIRMITAVPTRDIAIDPRQPSRLLKKNSTELCFARSG